MGGGPGLLGQYSEGLVMEYVRALLTTLARVFAQVCEKTHQGLTKEEDAVSGQGDVCRAWH